MTIAAVYKADGENRYHVEENDYLVQLPVSKDEDDTWYAAFDILEKIQDHFTETKIIKFSNEVTPITAHLVTTNIRKIGSLERDFKSAKLTNPILLGAHEFIFQSHDDCNAYIAGITPPETKGRELRVEAILARNPL